jgi:hypothetical protein
MRLPSCPFMYAFALSRVPPYLPVRALRGIWPATSFAADDRLRDEGNTIHQGTGREPACDRGDDGQRDDTRQDGVFDDGGSAFICPDVSRARHPLSELIGPRGDITTRLVCRVLERALNSPPIRRLSLASSQAVCWRPLAVVAGVIGRPPRAVRPPLWGTDVAAYSGIGPKAFPFPQPMAWIVAGSSHRQRSDAPPDR